MVGYGCSLGYISIHNYPLWGCFKNSARTWLVVSKIIIARTIFDLYFNIVWLYVTAKANTSRIVWSLSGSDREYRSWDILNLTQRMADPHEGQQQVGYESHYHTHRWHSLHCFVGVHRLEKITGRRNKMVVSNMKRKELHVSTSLPR